MRLPVRALRASTLIDAGGRAGDKLAVTEGTKIFRRLTGKSPNNPALRYNLANGLSQLAKLETYSGPEWYISTQSERREARCLYREVANNTKSADLKAQALINAGNELDCGYRWVEAYDCWVRALAVDSSNGVAALSTARMLLRRLRDHKQLPFSDSRAAGFYTRLAVKRSTEIERIAGSEAAQLTKSLPTLKSSWKPRPPYKIKNDFARFVSTHRLALVGTIEGVDFRKKRWDNIHIPSIVENIETGPGVPPVFTMFNQLKADFCTARWLAYVHTSNPPKDTSLYMDTLDYSLYGIAPSLLVLAQRAALDILDRVAACANDYFHAGDKPNGIHFRNFWRENQGTGTWRPWVQSLLSTPNPGIIALGELASDLTEGSALCQKYNSRNISTHRFCVLHDLAKTPSRVSPAIEHYDLRSFLDQTIETLQITRSAILYLLDAIAWHEANNATDGLKVPMFVRPHHYIRGQK